MRIPMLCLLGALGLGAQTSDPAPGLEWRSMTGELRTMTLDPPPGADLSGVFGVWMRPLGWAPYPALEGLDVANLEFGGGDRLLGKIEGGNADSLYFVGPSDTHLQVPIDSLRSLVFTDRRLGTQTLAPPTNGDRLYRLVGKSIDRVDGVLVGFSDQGIALETSLGERVFAWGEVVALFVEALEDTEPAPTDGVKVLLDLTCGSRLTGRLSELQAGGVQLRYGAFAWRIPYAWIRELTVLDGSFRYLSWLEPVEDEAPRSPFDPPGSPPLGMVWPQRIDRTTSGALLAAGGRIWPHGIGVHAPNRLRWKLEPGDCWLRLAATLDDSAVAANRVGSVSFQVLVDGKEAWNSGLRRGGQAPISPDPIDVRGAQVLELVVTDGGDGPVLDRAAWLAPMLVRCSGAEGR